MIREIFEFNTQALGVQAKDVPHLEYKHAAFCVKALREEADELQTEHAGLGGAIEHPPGSEAARWQTVKSIDAAIDSAYFAIGLLRRAGLTEEQAIDCFVAVHGANMTKKLGVNARRDTGAVDAVKPADFVPPERKLYRIIYGVDAPLPSQEIR